MTCKARCTFAIDRQNEDLNSQHTMSTRLRSEMHRLLVLLFATFKKSIHGSKNVSKDEQSIATERELQMLYAASTLKQLVAVQWVRELLRKSSKIQEKDDVSRTLLVRMDDQLSSMMENFAISQRVAFTPMPFPCESRARVVLISKAPSLVH